MTSTAVYRSLLNFWPTAEAEVAAEAAAGVPPAAAAIEVSGTPFLAVAPNGGRVYVTNFDSNSVSVIDASNNTVVATIPVGKQPAGVAVAPNGRHVYVSSKDLTTDTMWIVSVIDTITNTVATTTQVATGGGIVVMTARNVYVANTGSSTVSVIDI